MPINEIILWIVSGGAVLGGLDYILKNKFGLGEEFENGIKSLGPLALAMIGIISLAPVIGNFIRPLATLLTFINADPSLAASILAVDMGGYPLARALALTPSAAAFSGLIIASMLGATIVFSIPVALSIIKKEDEIFLAKGLLAGIITIPIGALAAGLAAKFPIQEVLYNTAPLAILTILLASALAFYPRATMKTAIIFGKIILAIVTLGLIAGAVEALTGIVIIKGMAPLDAGFKTIGIIAVVLMGILPIIKILRKILSRQLESLGRLLNVNSTSIMGLVASVANNIPMFQLFEKMDTKGKILNAAFTVSGAFLLGDHLGFVTSVDSSMISYVLLGKIIAATTAIPVALIIAKKTSTII